MLLSGVLHKIWKWGKSRGRFMATPAELLLLTNTRDVCVHIPITIRHYRVLWFCFLPGVWWFIIFLPKVRGASGTYADHYMRLEHSAVIKQNDLVQKWLCWMSNTWVPWSHSKADSKNFVKHSFPPKLLKEWHSPKCATKDLAMWLKRFFDAQDLLCSDNKLRPLVVKIDCAKGLCAVIMASLAICHIMLVVLEYAESHDWASAILSAVIDRVLSLIPSFHHLCRPLIIRQCECMLSARIMSHNALASHYEALLPSPFPHGTCTSTLCEYLVGNSVVCYYLMSQKRVS